MTSTIQDYLQGLKTNRVKRRRAGAVLLALSLIVATGVTWQLHLTGIAMTGDAYCGSEEHQHDESCYEKQLICGLEESEGHTHTDECYEDVLVCGKTEHIHTLACYSNSGADTETSADWEATLPSLTDDWADNVVAIAQSQLGYQESEQNYKVETDADGNEVKQGYTRYGAWYGNEYGDWCAMFASFCIHYAGIGQDAFPYAAGCQAWVSELSDRSVYAGSGAYAPKPGDLVFFDNNGDGQADHVGIVAEYNEATDGQTAQIKTIEGNSSDKVQNVTYKLDDSRILGYGQLPENPKQAENEENADNAAENAGSTQTELEERTITAETEDGVTFTAEGKLPEDACLAVKQLTDEQIAYIGESFEQVALGKTTYAYDIKLVGADGAELELGESVHITVSGLDFPEETDVIGYHLTDVDADNLTEADAQSVDVERVDVTADENGLSYDADGFSITVYSSNETETGITTIGYVSALTASITADGTEKFTESGSTDGDDANDHNGVVRTFDTVEYQLAATFASLSNTETATEATLHFEMTLPMGITQAQFDLDKMSWIGSNYLIEYLDADGNVVGTKDSTCAEGEYIVDGTKTTINANASGSTDGTSSYQVSGIVSQRITGSMALKATDSNPTVIPGTQTLSAGVKVLNAKNGATVEPTFKVWLDDNTENLGYASAADKSGDPSALDTNTVTMSGSYDETNKTGAVTVSAGALYNTELKQNGYLAYASWFDFSTGKELTASSKDSYTVGGSSVSAADVYELLETLGTLTENYGKSDPSAYTNNANDSTVAALLGGHSLSEYSSIFSNIRYGRMYSYGIALQMANRDESGDFDMKGLSLPQGDITLDLQISTSATSASADVDTTQYYSILWDYKENVSDTDPGKQGRNLTWDNGNSNTRYARGAVPYNSGYGNTACYAGGTWAMTGTSSASTADGTVYSFTVSGYDFDLDDYSFPRNRAMNSGDWAPYMNYEYNFSAGQAQVLSVYPRTNAGTVDVKQTLTVGNLSATTLSGTTVSKGSSTTQDTICYDYEVNTAGQDNTLTTGVTFYRPGTASRHSSFVSRKATSCADTFLGQTGNTDTYWVMNYDSTAYVGDKIAIWGDCYTSDASDVNITAFNLLQLFDSRAFSIDTEDSVKIILRSGTYDTANTKILYAADPDYRNGYDTNADGVQDYMNSVREEDLVYYESLSALEQDGYTCIGVMAEVRGCSGIINGFDRGFCGLRIPVVVNDAEGIVGETVSTTNTARIWVNDGAMMQDGTSISWTNGKWDSATGKNVLQGYQTITKFTSPTVAGNGNGFDLNNGNGTSGYRKAEFSEGQLVEGTHKGGSLYGCTLMVLGYKAGITIDSEKPAGQKTYDLSQETGTVTYTLSNIVTKLDDGADTSQDNTTSLTIGLSLTGQDKNGKALSGEDLAVELLKGRYSVLVTDENGEKTSVSLSADESNPTTVYYRFVTTTDANGDTSTTIEFLNASAGAGNNGTSGVGRQEWTETKAMTLWVDDSASDSKSATIHIGGAPVGWALPDMTAEAQLGDKLGNGDKVTATATIGGTGDKRAYDEVNGNYSVDTVSIVNLGASSFTKTRDHRYIELNGDVTYTITYTNKGTAALTENLYLYDLLPYNDDIRGTGKTGDTQLTGVGAAILDSSGKAVTDFGGTTVTVYYSTEPQSTLREKVEGFSEKDKSAVEAMLAGGSFTELGVLDSTTDTLSVPDAVQSQITCIYAVVSNLDAGNSLKLNLAMDTDGNAAADNYGNLAWAFVPGQGSELRTPIVQTTVVSRSISGVVWFDENLNGVRDEGEQLLDDVTCTLFRWNEETQQYEVCTADVTGATIGAQTTGADGAYSFPKLAAGNYVVAFNLPDKYAGSVNGATKYQAKGANDDTTNDGVALGKTDSSLDEDGISFAGISAEDYAYAIAYSLVGQTAGDLSLHTLEDYQSDVSLLNHYQEDKAHQDLGVTYSERYTLPEAGGPGNLPYVLIGSLLMAAAVVYGYERRRHERRARR